MGKYGRAVALAAALLVVSVVSVGPSAHASTSCNGNPTVLGSGCSFSAESNASGMTILSLSAHAQNIVGGGMGVVFTASMTNGGTTTYLQCGPAVSSCSRTETLSGIPNGSFLACSVTGVQQAQVQCSSRRP